MALRPGARVALERELDLDVVGVAYTTDELLALVGQLDIDVAVVGAAIGIERLRAEHPEVPLVALSSAVDRERARRCVALGIRAHIVKRDVRDPERVAEAARHAARGEAYLDREIQQLLVDIAAHAPDPALEAQLTSRELELSCR